jgi:hypothetical protein
MRPGIVHHISRPACKAHCVAWKMGEMLGYTPRLSIDNRAITKHRFQSSRSDDDFNTFAIQW